MEELYCGVLASNAEKFDLLAINRNNDVQIAIQVKTTSSTANYWTLSEKSIIKAKQSMFFVFVSFDYNKPDSRPIIHIVPSLVVKQYIESSIKQSQWKGDSKRFKDADNQYERRWQLLDDYCTAIENKELNDNLNYQQKY